MANFSLFQYYPFAQYNPFQPTMVFFTPIIPQNTYFPIPFVEIMDFGKCQPFQETYLPTYQICSLVQNQTPLTEIQLSEASKKVKNSSKKVVKREATITNENIEGHWNDEIEIYKKKPRSRLFVGMELNNENRNIIPNIMNQILAFVQKMNKSKSFLQRLFRKHPHKEQWTLQRYYCYMKRIRSSLGHYINENNLNTFITIKQPECEIYSHAQQLFYMKICRMTINYFLKTESIFISLTSKRMSSEKRKAHLIARRALLRKFEQILHDHQSQ